MTATKATPGAAHNGQTAASVAAIVPEHDEPDEILERTLLAIVRQTSAPQQVVLVDDGSSTPPALGPDLDGRVEVVSLPSAGGPPVARNWGARATDAEHLLFVDCDVILDRNWVERALAFMAEHEQVGAVSGKIVPAAGPQLLRDWSLHFIVPRIHRAIFDTPNPVMWNGAPANGHTPVTWIGGMWFVRRRAFEEIGGFDPRFWLRGEDWEFSQRLLASGHELYYLPDLFAESHEVVSVAGLARKSLRNDGWDLGGRSRDWPSADVKLLRPVAASLSVLSTLANHSARNLARRRFAFLRVDLAVAGASLGLIWRTWRGTARASRARA